jgi:hypothetical protein
MAIKDELKLYEIGGIGEIKNKTARFHEYMCGPDRSKAGDYLILAVFVEEKPPVFKSGYPDGQKLLTDLCNLHLAVKDKETPESAEIIAKWCSAHLHPYYFEEDELMRYDRSRFFDKEQMDFDINWLNYFSFSCKKTLSDLKALYENMVTAFTYKQLMDGNPGKAKDTYKPLLEAGGNDICKEWIDMSDADRTERLDRFMRSLPALRMGAQYSTEARKLLFLPYVSSVFDSAYYALVRFVSVDAGATSDTGGKTSLGVCKACGSIFVKNGNRQIYCDNVMCQSVRNNRKANNYYHRKKQQEIDKFIEEVLS